ncbi:acyl-CoA dehydrogenase family protein [Janibacter limosus]|uniref:Acyl-CoA dehydrogenase family protein n=1 Tax=Janibacter limosus TaxID=53458 RepID=A0AC61U413_9MICO|nr:acyl-CoA dehydrogenase family protein [Janibacter limosus]UUZ44776.1 acyl-CoA dehydrogenase family protein [Janibacter limosus]
MFEPTPYRSPWMSDDLDDVRTLARTFLERELVPHADRFTTQGAVDREFWNKAGDAGLLCISIPEEYGGGGTFAHEAVVAEEQARAIDDGWANRVHSTIVAHYVLAYGTEEQKQRWLPKMASGEMVGAIAMTEPGAGSDLQSLRTTARRDGDDLVINGAKTFISNGLHCDLLIIVTRTGGEGGRGLSPVVAETADLPGFSRGRKLDKVGLRYRDTMELFFEDMRVPAANILGGEAGEGQGFIQLMQQLGQERLIIGLTGVATAEIAVELAIAYAKEREAFGRPILKFQNLRFELAECRTETLAARTLVDHCIGLHLQGKLDPATASMAKYYGTDVQCDIIDRCLQVFGGYGFMTEYPIGRMYASARVQKIYGGTNEIMKELISRTL